MSEGRTHLSIARARAGMVVPPTPADGHDDADRIRATVAAIPDPELPVVTLAELGIVHDVTVTDETVHVSILPTFIGCPALDVMGATIEAALAPFGRAVTVEPTYAVPWTSERITPSGRAALIAAGIAPPADPKDVRCPHCASGEVVMDSAFGPTQCRSLYYCRACRQPFEAMKVV